MKNIIDVKEVKGRVSDIELRSVRNMFQHVPEITDCLKRKDISTLIKIMSEKPSVLNSNFNKLLTEVDPVFAGDYFTTSIYHHIPINLSYLIINNICINSDIAPLYLLRCKINELIVELTDFEDAKRAYAYLLFILIISECDINTMRVKLKPGTEYDSFKNDLKHDLAQVNTNVQNIIIE